MPVDLLVPLSHIDRRMAAIGSRPFDDPWRSSALWEIDMTTVRQTVISLMVLAASMLVQTAPFRWW